MSRPVPPHRDAYRWFCPITTRWHDNDVYQHVNNTIYYSFFDTVINEYLIREGGLDFEHGEIVGLASGHQAYKNALRVVEAQTADLRRQLTRLRKTLREHGGSTRRLAPRGCKKRRR